MALVTAFSVTVGAPMVAALFTDAQWADMQSIANFAVLVYIAYRNEKRVPQLTAHETAEEIKSGITDPQGGLRDDLAELVVEAMARRADRYPRDRNR